jgi:hypothetical protein
MTKYISFHFVRTIGVPRMCKEDKRKELDSKHTIWNDNVIILRTLVRSS